MRFTKLLGLFLAVCLTACIFGTAARANALGDADGDGQLSAEDARLCLRQAVGLEDYAKDSAAYAACDATGDGDVTAEDARMILRAAVGLETLGALEPEEPGTNEYDILRSGTFYCTGSMKDEYETNPLEMAITANSIYMRTEMEGVEMALLQKDGKIYMIYPEKKIYLEVSKTLQNLMGIDDGMLSADDLGFADMKPLDTADTVADGELGGVPCKIYTFIQDSGSRSVIYMDGNRLLAFETVDASGSRVTTYITSITADVPADKRDLPAGYKKVGLLKFMNALEGVIL